MSNSNDEDIVIDDSIFSIMEVMCDKDYKMKLKEFEEQEQS